VMQGAHREEADCENEAGNDDHDDDEGVAHLFLFASVGFVGENVFDGT